MKILIAGDLAPYNRVQVKINEGQFDDIFQSIKPLTEMCDYSLVNLEAPITPEGCLDSINKVGPRISTSKGVISLLKNAGFDCVTLANNHFRDFGETGTKTTIDSLKSENIDFLGGGNDLEEASKVLYKRFAEKTIAFVNFCENEFSVATEDTSGSNKLELIDNYHQITEAKSKADIVVVIVHGGHEHYQLPSPRMIKLYRWLIDIGANAVINHHQHCYSGYEIYKEAPIFYGIGNFCFDWPNRAGKEWNEGYLVLLDIENAIKFEIIPYIQCAELPIVTLMKGQKKDVFDEDIKNLNAIICDPQKVADEFAAFIESCSKGKLLQFSSYENRYLKSLALRGIIPIGLSKKKALYYLNNLRCEAHRDVAIAALLNYIES